MKKRIHTLLLLLTLSPCILAYEAVVSIDNTPVRDGDAIQGYLKKDTSINIQKTKGKRGYIQHGEISGWITLSATRKTEKSSAKKNIKFGNETYTLEFKVVNTVGEEREILNEYIRPPETLESWTKLISIRAYPKTTDPHELARSLAHRLDTQNDPKIPFQVAKSEDGNHTLIDFIMMDVDEKTDKLNFVEFNVFVYKDNPHGEGAIAYQYAERAYGDSVETFFATLHHTRVSAIKKVTEYNFPDVE